MNHGRSDLIKGGINKFPPLQGADDCFLSQGFKIDFLVCPFSRLRERVRERGSVRERIVERAGSERI